MPKAIHQNSSSAAKVKRIQEDSTLRKGSYCWERGDISQALCDFAAELDFDVTVADDRPDFANYTLFPKAAEVICDTFYSAIKKLHISPFDYVAVLTRGHRWDQLCLESIFSGRYPSYLGLVGSGRRVSGLFDILEKEGFSRDLMEKVHTPIGHSDQGCNAEGNSDIDTRRADLVQAGPFRRQWSAFPV